MRPWIFAAAALGLATSAAAQDTILTDTQLSNARALMASALESDEAYELLADLTTRVGPRLAGSAQEDRARRWAITNLNRLGFDPRVEPFEVPYWERGVETAEIVTPFPQPLLVTALGYSAATPPGGVTAPVVRFENLDALRRADRADVEGKIVFIDETMTRTQDGSGYGPAVRKRRETGPLAASLGARAALIRSVSTASHRFPHTGGSGTEIIDGAPVVPVGALAGADADQLTRALERAEEVVVKLEMSPKYLGARPSANIIVDIPGSEKPEEIVVIGGHLDSWDLGTGALDDGAGVAITMAAMSLIQRAGLKPKRTIRLILWGSEEVGLVGARAYVERHRDDMVNHVYGSESDFGAGKLWRCDSNVSKEALPLADAVCAALKPLGVNRGPNDAGGGPDLIPFREAGMPVADLQQNGWDYFDYHHTPDDTLDKVDPADLRQNVAGYAAFAYLAADIEGDWRAGRLTSD